MWWARVVGGWFGQVVGGVVVQEAREGFQDEQVVPSAVAILERRRRCAGKTPSLC